MDARRSKIDKEIGYLTARDAPSGVSNKDNPGPIERGKNWMQRQGKSFRQSQREGANPGRLQELEGQLNKIDDNRDRMAERTSRAELKMKKSPGDMPMFAEGGPVKAQLSGKGFKGTF
jgi:hypothetical protein